MGRAWPATCAGRASRSSRSTDRIPEAPRAVASPTHSMPSKQPGPPSRPGHRQPKSRDGAVEAIRVLVVAKRSARQARVKALLQMRHLGYSAPEQLRCRTQGPQRAALVAEGCGSGRPVHPIRYRSHQGVAVLIGPSHRRPRRELAELDERIEALLVATVPDLLELFGVGPDTAAALVIAAGDNPERLHSEAAWAHLCGVAPIADGSGKTSGKVRPTAAATARPTARSGASSWCASPTTRDQGSTSSAGSRRADEARGHPYLEALRRPRGLSLQQDWLQIRRRNSRTTLRPATGGPPGSRSRHLGIKRAIQIVQIVRRNPKGCSGQVRRPPTSVEI